MRLRHAAYILLILSATASASDAQSRARHWSWSGSFVGNACGADDVSVALRPDGTGTHRSVTRTAARPGGYWWWSLEGLDSGKAIIWKTPYRRGPRMNAADSSPRYRFDYDFAFPATQYGRTTYLRLRHRCEVQHR